MITYLKKIVVFPKNSSVPKKIERIDENLFSLNGVNQFIINNFFTQVEHLKPTGRWSIDKDKMEIIKVYDNSF